MRVFIREEKRDVHIRIYGIGGEQRTKEFFDAVFVDMSCVYPTTEEERAEYGTTGVYTFESRAAFDKFCEYHEILQETLDTIAEALIDENSVEEYCFEYVVENRYDRLGFTVSVLGRIDKVVEMLRRSEEELQSGVFFAAIESALAVIEIYGCASYVGHVELYGKFGILDDVGGLFVHCT